MQPPYSIMFHHFHDENHVASQGSLSADEFARMLDWLAERYTIIGAHEYLERFEGGTLTDKDICLSFDDALLCQWDVAVPVMRQRGITAYFFVYSSVFTGTPDYLEIFRYFRTTAFDGIEDFYDQFFELMQAQDAEGYAVARKAYESLNYLSHFPFYTESDKWFRYLRDQQLGPKNYNAIMLDFMEAKGFDVQAASKSLWMTEMHLKTLASEGHLIGLHSFSHPTQMSKLPADEQRAQYQRNREHLESVLEGRVIISMSHPCGDYNDETLSILKDMGIRIGFRSSLSIPDVRSPLEIPRDDHANIWREMHK